MASTPRTPTLRYRSLLGPRVLLLAALSFALLTAISSDCGANFEIFQPGDVPDLAAANQYRSLRGPFPNTVGGKNERFRFEGLADFPNAGSALTVRFRASNNQNDPNPPTVAITILPIASAGNAQVIDTGIQPSSGSCANWIWVDFESNGNTVNNIRGGFDHECSNKVAKTVACILGDGDQGCNSAEGYYRQLLASADPPAVILVGGNAQDLNGALAEMAPGGHLIMFTHGNAGYFRWGSTRYAGFLGGAGTFGTGVTEVEGEDVTPFLLPPNFTIAGINVTVDLVSCYSDAAPAFEGGLSWVDNTRAALANGAAVNGFCCKANSWFPDYTLTGGTAAQRDAAQACLEATAPQDPRLPNLTARNRVRAWLARFRPASSGETPNAQTKADDAINAVSCPGAGGAVQIGITYGTAPKAMAYRSTRLLAEDEPHLADCEPGVAARVPMLGGPWLWVISALVMGLGVVVMRTRKESGPA